MRTRRVLEVALLVLVLGTGCPEFHKKGGFIDRAAYKDMKENSGIAKPPLCGDGSRARNTCDKSFEALEAEEFEDGECGWVCP
jgi:hypothetical protein